LKKRVKLDFPLMWNVAIDIILQDQRTKEMQPFCNWESWISQMIACEIHYMDTQDYIIANVKKKKT
jgi:hypothetical protein